VDKQHERPTLFGPMRFERASLAAVEYFLPDEIVSSEDLERALEPTYRRFGLHVGRLELMTGIRTRRFFPPLTRPSEVASSAGEAALARSGVGRERIGLLVHASVCRDFLEPATATVVHDRLGLPSSCAAFDLSNACLGFVNALALVASQVDSGAIEAGLVVAGECGRPLVERTIDGLNARQDLTRDELKAAFASLTIGSGAAAAVVTRAERDAAGARLMAAVSRAATRYHVLCHGDYADGGMTMSTDAEALLHAGNELARATFDAFLAESGWRREQIERVVTHQVGAAHRKLLLETLALDPALDFPTVAEFGNVGSVSLPLSLARARESGFLRSGQRAALLGIGSGLQCQMLALQA